MYPTKVVSGPKISYNQVTIEGEFRRASPSKSSFFIFLEVVSPAGKLVWQHRRLVWIGKLYVPDCVSPFVGSPDICPLSIRGKIWYFHSLFVCLI